MKPHENGSLYYNIDIAVNDEKNKFGQDVSIFDSQTKEERESKAAKSYLGNGKTVWSNEKATTNTDTAAVSTPTATTDDLPF